MDKVAQAISEFIEDAINVQPLEMLIQVLATLLLFLVVRLFFWNSITDYLNKRKELMNSEIAEAQKSHEQAKTLQETVQAELSEVRNNAKGIIEDAKSRGEQERVKIISKAKADAKNVMDNAKKEIDSEIEKARSSMNDEIVSVATLMAEKIIKKEIDEDKHKDLIKEVTSEVQS
jgi:F-type H+-transporting ATPase subunit b